MSRSRDLGDVGSKANFLDNVSTDLGDFSGQSIPHIIPDVLYPAVEGKDLAGVAFSGSYVYGTAHTDGRKYYYTDIKGSKPIKDPRIGGHFGSQRHKFKSLQLLEQETATEGSNVYSIDGREWCRHLRNTGATTVYNTDEGVWIQLIFEDSSFFEITGYFSSVNLIGRTHTSSNYGVKYALNGGSYQTLSSGSDFNVSVTSPLINRYVDCGSVINVTSTTLGLNTIKISTGAMLFGFELIAQDTSNRNNIQIPSQNVVSYGKKFNVSGTPHYDPFNGFTSGSSVSSYIDTDTSLGVEKWKNSSTYYRPYNGGRVVKWVDSSGVIKTSVTLMPPNAKSIADSSSLTNGTAKANASASNDTFYPTFEAHTTDVNEDNLHEVAKTFHWREFGNGSANGGTGATYADASMLSGTGDDIAYVMDDGLTSLSGDGVNWVYGLKLNDSTADIYITFIGTGISLRFDTNTNSGVFGGTDHYEIHIDGVEIEDYTNGDSVSGNLDVYAQNLPYGTHILRLERISANTTPLELLEVAIHQPKRPPIPEDACVIADYMLMADYVARTDSGSGANISKGIRRISSRDIFYDAGDSFNTLSFQPDANYAPNGMKVFVASDRSAGDVKNKLPAFGTRFEVGSYASRLDNFFVNGVSVDETPSGSTYTAFITQDADSTLGNNIFEARNSATNNGNSSYFDVATPIHTSSHYQSFETPFLHELVGGDRNMEQTNLVVSPDGKTWDEVTRDTSYIGNLVCRMLTDTATDWSATVIFDEWRGINNDCRNIFNKYFAIAYDRIICLEDGVYKFTAENYCGANSYMRWAKSGSGGHLAFTNSSGHLTNIEVFQCKRGDYVSLIGDFGDDSLAYNNAFVEKLS